MDRQATYHPEVAGNGLVLRRWDEDLMRQMAAWSERGFPYHAFDLGSLRSPERAAVTLARMREAGQHRHFVACEGDIAVGRASVNLQDAAGLYLWSVHVPPEHERRGVCRRMLATLMTWLEAEQPGRDFVLSSNSFAAAAHRAYEALGFKISETRWHFDREVADALWKANRAQREQVSQHARFMHGRWEVRMHLYRRRRGTPMTVPEPRPVAASSVGR